MDLEYWGEMLLNGTLEIVGAAVLLFAVVAGVSVGLGLLYALCVGAHVLLGVM